MSGDQSVLKISKKAFIQSALIILALMIGAGRRKLYQVVSLGNLPAAGRACYNDRFCSSCSSIKLRTVLSSIFFVPDQMQN